MSDRPSANSSSHGFSYQPALDGIRALAVAAVLAYHANMPWARGGFLGVDAFFVLSGFLITSLLVGEWRRSGKIGLLAFWTRRARRLLPALFLMLLGVAFYAAAFAGPLELGRIRGDALATIAYVANWRPVLAGVSYFDQFLAPSPLRHTWSLGIEEQYYLIWPLLLGLLLVVRRVPLRAVIALTTALMLASVMLMALLFQPGGDPSRVYYGTDTRAQSLLVGALLAMTLPRLRPLLSNRNIYWALQSAAIACFVGIGWAWSTTSGNSMLLYRGGFLLLACGVAIVIMGAVQPNGLVRRTLALPPLRGLGLISYGVYLWHWPIYLMLSPGRTGLDTYPLFALRVAVTLVVAASSYHIIELPVRHGAFRGYKISWMLAPAAAGCVALALVFVTRGGFSPVTARPAAAMPQVEDVATVSRPPRILILGDSVGLSLDPGFSDVANQSNISVWNPSILKCGFIREDYVVDLLGNNSTKQEAECEQWRENWATDVAVYDPDLVVMVFGAWDYRDHVVNGATLTAGSTEWNNYVLMELERERKILTAGGAKLVLLTWPCQRPIPWTEMGSAGVAAEKESLERVNMLNDVYRQFAAGHPESVGLVDLFSYVCPEGKYTDLVIDGVKLREDGTHFTPASSPIVAEWLLPQLMALSNRPR
jgi:peptidoglycan/LPS O-acetylase OafA/YrhL